MKTPPFVVVRCYWNGDLKGEAETLWVSPQPSWFVGNRFIVRHVDK